MLKYHWSFLFQTDVPIEKETDLIPEIDDPKHPLIFFCYIALCHSLLFPNPPRNLTYPSHVSGNYAIYYIPQKHPMQNVWGNCSIGSGLDHFDEPKSREFEVFKTSLESQRVV